MMQTPKSFLRQACWAGFLGLAIVSFPASGLTLTVEEVSNPRPENGWVTDMADLLSPATEAAINCQISALEAKNGSEIAVVTVPETAPDVTPKEFATIIFNHWGMGKQGQDNGVLVLVSKADRRVEIAIGYGLEGILPDAKVGNIIYQTMIPHFKRADYDGGTLAGTTLLVQALEPEPKTTVSSLIIGVLVEPVPPGTVEKRNAAAWATSGGNCMPILAITPARSKEVFP